MTGPTIHVEQKGRRKKRASRAPRPPRAPLAGTTSLMLLAALAERAQQAFLRAVERRYQQGENPESLLSTIEQSNLSSQTKELARSLVEELTPGGRPIIEVESTVEDA